MVHNLEVEGAHTYYAGGLEAWGHNAGWTLTPGGAVEIRRHSNFGNFFCRVNRLGERIWAVADNAGHGGSAFKFYTESSTGLEWWFDADENGNEICGKHKGPVGKEIPWKDLIPINWR